MSRRRYGVNQAYHGRRKGSGALKVLVALLAILLVCRGAVPVVCAQGVYGQRREASLSLECGRGAEARAILLTLRP